MARILAAQTGLPLIHLDQVFWQPGWRTTPEDQWKARHEELISGERWILDGTFTSTCRERARRADLIVFVDLPRWRCLWRVLWRVATTYGRVRPDLAPGCPERFDLEFLRYVWSFKAKNNPRIEAAIYDGNVIRLRSQDDIDRWLATLS